MNGLYLASPHGSLIYDGKKTSIATNRRTSITGERLLCSKEDGVGLAFGIASVGEPALLDIPSFDAQVKSHQVSRSSRERWWPDAQHLYNYPILRFAPFPAPIEVPVEPGVTMDMGEVSFPQIQDAVKSLPLGSEIEKGLVIMSTPATIMSSASKEESEMPYTVSDPPRPAKNWTTEEKRKCVAAANGALRDDPKDEQGAIFACIRAAGKTQHPGGKKDIDPEDYVIAEELVKGYLETVKSTAADNDLPDSCFLYVESGDKDSEGKTIPRSKRHLPYKFEDGSLDLRRLRNALSRLGQPKTGGGEEKWLSASLRKSLTTKAQRILKGAKKELLDLALKSEGGDRDNALIQLAELLDIDEVEEKAGDMGDGDTHTCTCPKCGTQTEVELGSPCREEECPKCGTRMRGGDEDTESSKSSPVETETVEEEKAGRRINSSVLSKLKDLISKLKEIVDWGDGTDKQDVVSQIVSQVGKSYAFKTYTTKDGKETWFTLWPTNSYEDREGEFFTSEALKNFVERHQDEEVKGQAWFWHVPGSKFGTIYHQDIIEDHFLFQLGKFDDTPVGRAFKEFFSAHPDGHLKIAPWGWGASHGFAYVRSDRERDGTYRWLDIKESTVLPVHHAANIYNPQPYFEEGNKMNDKTIEAIKIIGEATGIDLFAEVTNAAHLKKEELDGKVKHKSVEPPPEEDETKKEQVPGEKDESPILTPEVVQALAELLTPTISGPTTETGKPDESKSLDISEIAKEVISAAHLAELSAAWTELVKEVKEVRERLEQVERSDKEKVVEMHDLAFQPAWMIASQAQETAVKDKAVPSQDMPDAVKAIAGLISN